MPFPTFTLGGNATFDNTVTDPIDCITFSSPVDGLKEGVLLNMIRISSSDPRVYLGRDQALLVQEANGG